MSRDMKIFTGVAGAAIAMLAPLLLASGFHPAAPIRPGRPEARPAREATGRPALTSAAEAAEPAAGRTAGPASTPVAKVERLSGAAHAALLRSKNRLSNADIPASWLKEKRSPPDPSFIERRERRARRFSEELELRLEMARLQAEEAERQRQRELEERRVAALEKEAEALEWLPLSGWYRPWVKHHRRWEEGYGSRADRCLEKTRPWRTVSVKDSRGSYRWGSGGLSGGISINDSDSYFYWGTIVPRGYIPPYNYYGNYYRGNRSCSGGDGGINLYGCAD